MKIRAVVKALILSLFVAGLSFSVNASSNSTPQRSFNRTFKSSNTPKATTTTKAITATEVDTFETEAGTVSKVANSEFSVATGDESWDAFGLTPKPWKKDRSMFPNPDGCTIKDRFPCTKPCASKCKKPCAPCNKPKCVQCPPIMIEEEPFINYLTVLEEDIYQDIHFKCGNFAPIDFQWVDFRLQKGRKYGAYSDQMGKYRFRIFGCRREAKDILLNKGRTIEKDMHFIDIFEDIVDGCVPLTKIPDNLCANPNQPLPEYVVTAEITNFFMNVCDEYDWDKSKKMNKRNGSAEITVVWRIMDLTKTNTLWKGTTNGYSDVYPGNYNGELMLIERAFADAVDNLRQQPGFIKQLSTRVHPQELSRQRQAIIEMQFKNTPEKCPIVEQQNVSDCCANCPKSSCKDDDTVWVEIEKTVTEEPMFIEESYGVTSYGDVIAEKITKEKPIEDSGVIVEASSVDEYASIIDKSVLCIKERNPYDNLGTEEMLLLQSSLVKVKDSRGHQAAGLLLSEQYVLTSADLVNRKNNTYEVTLANNETITAKAFRINPKKNTGLLLLDREVEYTPLSISLDLPVIDEVDYSTIALVNTFDKEYTNVDGTVTGYRYSDNIGVEIIADTNTQKSALGGMLINKKGTVFGFSNAAVTSPEENDLFTPMETTLQSLGLEICEQEFTPSRPKYTPISDAIANSDSKEPEAMDKKDRK